MSQQELIDAMVDMREDEAVAIATRMLDEGTDPLVVLDASKEAMEQIGRAYESGDAFLPELILAGEMLGQISEVIKPHLKSQSEQESLGTVVIGTVEGDIHDIAKDIVVFMLEVSGFTVVDLGVDVPPQKFVDAVQESGAKVVGLSGFLTLAFDPMKNTVSALRDVGGGDVKVMIGGGQIDEQVRTYTGADAYGKDAMAAVALAKQWLVA